MTQTLVEDIPSDRAEEPRGASARLSRLVRGLADAASITCSGELAQTAPRLLCEAGAFDRAMLSSVEGSRWRPQTLVVVRGETDPVNRRLVAALPDLTIPLGGSLVEAEVVRRRVSVVVDHGDGRRHSSGLLGELSRSPAYVVAPIVVADRVVGLVHVDCFASERILGETDRVLLAMFASLLGLQYERCLALERLESQRVALAAALSLASAELVATQAPGGSAAVPAWAPAPGPGTEQPGRRPSAAVAALTPREWHILGLVATGATNPEIASALVLSESTVKSHVKRILHKLPAANRAEAVFRYTELRRRGAPA